MSEDGRDEQLPAGGVAAGLERSSRCELLEGSFRQVRVMKGTRKTRSAVHKAGVQYFNTSAVRST